MQIEHEQLKKKGVFLVNKDGERLAELAYFTSAPGQITVYHTEVSEQLRGEGIGKKLVAAVVKYARENNLKIIPTCPYARKVIETTPAFQDVLSEKGM